MTLGINTINLASGGNDSYEYMAVLNQLVNPIISNSKKENWVVLIFYRNDMHPQNIAKEKLLKDTKSIISLPINENIIPTNEYKKGINSLIKNYQPTSKKEIIKELKSTLNKSIEPTNFTLKK